MTGIIILAAGASTRLGRPKQTLIYKGQTLLRRSIEAALGAGCGPVIVVLGANAADIKPTISHTDIQIVYNDEWAEGMASSIRAGLTAMRQLKPGITSVILMLCDQPFADADLLRQLVQKKPAASIVASAYNDTIGPPALFDMAYFDELLLLNGHEGAKKLLVKYKDDVLTIPFQKGSVDIDKMEDWPPLNLPR